MADISTRHEADSSGSMVWRYLLPVAVLVVVVAVISALVLTGVVSGGKDRPVAQPTSTTPTIEIAP